MMSTITARSFSFFSSFNQSVIRPSAFWSRTNSITCRPTFLSLIRLCRSISAYLWQENSWMLKKIENLKNSKRGFLILSHHQCRNSKIYDFHKIRPQMSKFKNFDALSCQKIFLYPIYAPDTKFLIAHSLKSPYVRN
jgi:hypothetical protein